MTFHHEVTKNTKAAKRLVYKTFFVCVVVFVSS